MRVIYARLHQEGMNAPVCLRQIGDVITDPVGFELNNLANGNPHVRLGVGDYLIDTHDDTMDGQLNVDVRGFPIVSLHHEAVASVIKAGVEDPNHFHVKTFDASGTACDIDGDFYIVAVLDDEGF